MHVFFYKRPKRSREISFLAPGKRPLQIYYDSIAPMCLAAMTIAKTLAFLEENQEENIE